MHIIIILYSFNEQKVRFFIKAIMLAVRFLLYSRSVYIACFLVQWPIASYTRSLLTYKNEK